MSSSLRAGRRRSQADCGPSRNFAELRAELQGARSDPGGGAVVGGRRRTTANASRTLAYKKATPSSGPQGQSPVHADGTAAADETTMLPTIAVILIVLWALGLVSSYTMGGFIHILLAIAIIVVLVRVIRGRRPI